MPAVVQRRDHLLELAHLLAQRAHRAVGRVRGEVAEGVVAPVVRQPAADQERLGDELVHRQQLDGGDAEVDQVLHDGRVGQPGVAAAQVLGDGRVQPGEALDVQLVDDRALQRHRLGDRRRAAGESATTTLSGTEAKESVASGTKFDVGEVVEDRAGVVDAAGDGAGVGVEQQLGGVEPGARGGVPGAVHPVAVALLGADAGHVRAPDAVGAQAQVVVGLAAVLVDQGQLDAGGPRGPEAEGGPAVAHVRAEQGRVRRDGQRGGGGHDGPSARYGDASGCSGSAARSDTVVGVEERVAGDLKSGAH